MFISQLWQHQHMLVHCTHAYTYLNLFWNGFTFFCCCCAASVLWWCWVVTAIDVHVHTVAVAYADDVCCCRLSLRASHTLLCNYERTTLKHKKVGPQTFFCPIKTVAKQECCKFNRDSIAMQDRPNANFICHRCCRSACVCVLVKLYRALDELISGIITLIYFFFQIMFFSITLANDHDVLHSNS